MMGLGGRSTDDTWINFPTSYNIQLLLKIYQNPFYVFQNCFIPCDSQASMMLLWILRWWLFLLFLYHWDTYRDWVQFIRIHSTWKSLESFETFWKYWTCSVISPQVPFDRLSLIFLTFPFPPFRSSSNGYNLQLWSVGIGCVRLWLNSARWRLMRHQNLQSDVIWTNAAWQQKGQDGKWSQNIGKMRTLIDYAHICSQDRVCHRMRAVGCGRLL